MSRLQEIRDLHCNIRNDLLYITSSAYKRQARRLPVDPEKCRSLVFIWLKAQPLVSIELRQSHVSAFSLQCLLLNKAWCIFIGT